MMREPIKTESILHPVPLTSWSYPDEGGDGDEVGNKGEFYPFSCLCSSQAARPLRPGR